MAGMAGDKPPPPKPRRTMTPESSTQAAEEYRNVRKPFSEHETQIANPFGAAGR
jgi:hypothetical protein